MSLLLQPENVAGCTSNPCSFELPVYVACSSHAGFLSYDKDACIVIQCFACVLEWPSAVTMYDAVPHTQNCLLLQVGAMPSKHSLGGSTHLAHIQACQFACQLLSIQATLVLRSVTSSSGTTAVQR